MQIGAGEIVHFDGTGEQGRIVRTVKIESRIAYIVAILNQASGKEMEALWRPSELKERGGSRTRKLRKNGSFAKRPSSG